MKYSDYFMKTLSGLGYKTCFYVGGGNSMHLLESASKYFVCVPVVHEVTAAIAAEYFNQNKKNNGLEERAFALVTAGPGFTNLVTGIAGAWLDSRELLVVGGQAKSTNLAKGTVRQVGHQEIDGTSIAKPITKKSVTLEQMIDSASLEKIIEISWEGRPGPVFIEVCLDVSAMQCSFDEFSLNVAQHTFKSDSQSSEAANYVIEKLKNSSRPLLLLGGGVSRSVVDSLLGNFAAQKIPIACTWTGADKVGSDYPYYAGRPNTYGMRWSNIFLQQADLLIAVGTSLGFQQTGFNIDDFLPVGELIQIDIDEEELSKATPRNRVGFKSDSKDFLEDLANELRNLKADFSDWTNYLSEIKGLVPTLESCQISSEPYLSPHSVIKYVSELARTDDQFVAASSGGTFTATMQILEVSANQSLIGNKGLASMGYGLAGAIGLATADHDKRTILFEGDGGFAQNMQDVGTVAANSLNLKIFITSNDGYASIRTSQKNYFDGHYLGCDNATGLGLPDWENFFSSFGIGCLTLNSNNLNSDAFKESFEKKGPFAFIILADPEQMYLPKIFSRISNDGTMQSAALHDMAPALGNHVVQHVFKYIPTALLPKGD